MGRVKELTVYRELPGGLFTPVVVSAERVLTDIYTCDFNFWIHHKVAIDGEEGWTISEATSGAAIFHSFNRRVCIDKARKKLLKTDIEEFRKLVVASLLKRKGPEMEPDVLWTVLSEQGFNLTNLELSDIKVSLEQKGYQIVKI